MVIVVRENGEVITFLRGFVKRLHYNQKDSKLTVVDNDNNEFVYKAVPYNPEVSPLDAITDRNRGVLLKAEFREIK